MYVCIFDQDKQNTPVDTLFIVRHVPCNHMVLYVLLNNMRSVNGMTTYWLWIVYGRIVFTAKIQLCHTSYTVMKFSFSIMSKMELHMTENYKLVLIS